MIYLWDIVHKKVKHELKGPKGMLSTVALSPDGKTLAKRRAFLTEIDPLYCNVIVRRFEQFSGKKAQRQTAN